MRDSDIDSRVRPGCDIVSGAIRGKNMAIPARGLDQAVRDWAISLVA